MSDTVKVWLYSLFAALIGGAVNSVAATYVAPEVFNFSHAGLIKLGQLALAGGLLGLLTYLKQSPLPKLDK